MITFKKKSNSNGFVILYAMLISSLILLISTGVFQLVQKELVLSSYARESQFAFYAADSALECALFWDISDYSVALGGTPFVVPPVGLEQHEITCNDKLLQTRYLAGALSGTANYDYPYIFRYPSFFDEANKSCAYVLVEKSLSDGTGTGLEVRITAVGFNVCVEGSSENVDTPDFDDPRLIEQRISITYSTSAA